MLLAKLSTVLFLLLAITLCWGVQGAVTSCTIPSLSQYLLNSVEQNSPPSSVLSTFTVGVGFTHGVGDRL